MYLSYGGKTTIEAWQSLVHVCRRWRSLVLGSPRHLNLQLCCTPEAPVRDLLDIWPALPLLVRGSMTLSDTGYVIAALGQSNRVCEVFLWDLADWQLERLLAVMQASFPEMTELSLFSDASRSRFVLGWIYFTSNWMAFHFWDCKNCFCLSLTL